MKQIFTLRAIRDAARERRSLVSRNHVSAKTPRPAAVIICMTGKTILGLIDAGLFIYEPQGGKRKKWGRHD